MFRSARFKITVWYVIAIMIISLTFSLVIYRSIVQDLNQRYVNIENQIKSNFRDLEKIPPVLQNMLRNDLRVARQRVYFMLLFANGGIFILSLLVGYFLAGRTLRPIEEMVEEQNRFISDASHELRTPLTALKTSTEVALRDKNMSAEEARKILEENLEDIGSLEMLSEHLLHLAQYQRGRRVLDLKKINLAESAGRVYKKTSAVAENKSITFEIEARDAWINADAISIEELILILLDNAFKYTPRGGKVLLKAAPVGRYGVLEVTDSGEGISPRDQGHIFDRFYRADRSRSKNRISGFGLGLPVAKSIAELHHGSIKVASRPGHGSTFTVRIPLV
jgi:two-component system, OmpR family, sensor histidine kinase CiaH